MFENELLKIYYETGILFTTVIYDLDANKLMKTKIGNPNRN